MNQQDFEDAFILMLSGAAEINQHGIKWKNKAHNECFIKFINNSLNKVIVVCFYSNGQKAYENKYLNGQLHGKSTVWRKDGNKWYEQEYRNGQQIKG